MPTLIDLGVSGCVWKVGGGVWVTLNHAKSSDETARNIGYCFNRLVPFLSIEWHSMNALFQGVCRVTIICLGGV